MNERQDHDAEWRTLAACARSGVDPDWFFPIVGDARGEGIRHAKRVCATCPVTTPCLDYALTHSVSGVMGGMTVGERKQERVRRRDAP